jgi:uncharacterized protein YecE (DUF72 family)
MSEPVRIGCSGWQYADWRDRFYAPGTPQRLWLPAYAERFDTVEVNSTYGSRGRRGNYSRAELQQWARRIAQWRRRTAVWAYFNNDWEAFAPANALALGSVLPASGLRAPGRRSPA